MANLNAWQKIDRVLPKKPFGDGINGSATISADPNTRATAIGTSGNPNLTAGSTAFANGDLVLIHQTRGSGAGNYEYNLVLSGGGTTSLVLLVNKQYSYVAGAQIIKIPRYLTAVINAHSIPAWNGSTGGIEVICAKKTITTGGVLNANGLGFTGAPQNTTTDADGYQGEGTAGAGGTRSIAKNGNGAGGGDGGTGLDNASGGGGGGHASAGTQGQNGQQIGGLGGDSAGSADLITLVLGGGGSSGGMGRNSASYAASGGNGGGIIILISNLITITNNINTNGNVGSNGTGSNGAGGGGSGGAILAICNTASIGSNLLNAGAGAGGTSGATNNGGAGSVGRIAVHYKNAITGSSTPASTNTQDPSLIETSYGLIY